MLCQTYLNRLVWGTLTRPSAEPGQFSLSIQELVQNSLNHCESRLVRLGPSCDQKERMPHDAIVLSSLQKLWREGGFCIENSYILLQH